MSIVHISGRIGRDADLKTVNDNKVCNFSVAENIGFGDNKKTQWWSCALWGKRGESLAQYLAKGAAVTVCGEVSTREYDGKDGTRKHELQCRVLDVALQGGREQGDTQPTKTPQQEKRETAPAGGADKGEFNDDIPFAFLAPTGLGLLALASYVSPAVGA